MRVEVTPSLLVDLYELAMVEVYRREAMAGGLPTVRIFASGGLDEHEIDRLVHGEKAPLDGFGVGSALGVSADAPVLDSVYKLVAYDGRPVRKTSAGKSTWPGAKQVWRADDWSGDILTLAGEPAPRPGHRPLLEEVMRGGNRTPAGRRTLPDARRHFEHEWSRLPAAIQELSSPPEYPVAVSPAARSLAAQLDSQQLAAEEAL